MSDDGYTLADLDRRLGDGARLTPSDASPNLTHAVEGTPNTGHLETIAKAAQDATAARETLEAAIIAARRDRVSLRAIADAGGLSHEQVRRIAADVREANGA